MGLLSTTIMIALGLIGVIVIHRFRWTATERRVISVSFVVHILSAFAQLGISLFLYAGSDSVGYFRRASAYADLITSAPFIWVPRVLAHTFQIDIGWPLSGFALTTSGSMTGLTVFPVLLTGKSLYATFVFFALASFFGKVLCLRAVRTQVPSAYRARMAVVFLLLPSAVFWTCGIVKESVAVCGLGLAMFGWARVVHRMSAVTGALLTAIGALAIGLVKPYILFPFVLAAGVWYYWTRGGEGYRQFRPIHFVVGAVIAIGGVLALGEMFPQYSTDRVGEEVARLQELGGITRGGTSYDIADSGETERTLAGQVAYAPLALATSLFRPLPFEAVNATSAVNAIEVTILLLLLMRAIWSRGIRGFARMIYGNPFLMFAAVFTLIAGIAIGLATTNLGTLSRYRVPMFPFYVALIAAAYPLPQRRRRPRVQPLPARLENKSR